MGKTVSFKTWTRLIHLTFWIFLGVLMSLVYHLILKEWGASIGVALVNLGGLAVLVYGHLLFLFPRFYVKRKFGLYALGLGIILVLTSLFRLFTSLSLVPLLVSDPAIANQFNPSFFGSILLGSIFLVVITFPLQLIKNWFKQHELEQQLKTHQLEAELRFLKAQVNPHFLFNALNNIYALSFIQSEKTPDMILKLSDMMSYMLYDCKSDEVLLTTELTYLDNYIDLQQLKKDGALSVSFEYSGKMEGVQIPPMLFIPFFENAFKHGNLENTISGWLKSRLEIKDDFLYFSISNTLPKIRQSYPKGGVGLENIKERLHLIYGNRHQLSILHEKEIFVVDLVLELKPAPLSS